MNKRGILACVLVMMLGLIPVSGAQTMETQTLSNQQRCIVTISAFAASGDLASLKTALSEGLDAGLTINEIKEILVQLYAYAGFPRSLNGIDTFMAVLEERRTSGIEDTLGKEATPMPAGFNRDEFGAQTRARIGGRTVIPPPSGYQLFAPAIDTFLKEHLFADIFYRDNLDWQSRELATISALAVISGTDSQLRFHMGGAMNMGLTEEQMKDFIAVLRARVGDAQGLHANQILNAVLESRK